MSQTMTYVSAEELLAMPDDGQRHELVRGVLTTMAPTGYRHGKIEWVLGYHLGAFLDQHPIGEVCVGDTGLILGRNPDTVLAPDLAFVRTDRVPDGTTQDGFLKIAPDLAIEILSPTDRRKHTLEKVDIYLAAGVTLVWLIQPKRETVTVYRRGRDPIELAIGGDLVGEDVLPGFTLPIKRLFA